MLWPYVKSRLDKLRSAEKGYESTLRQIWERETKLLDEGKAPKAFYDKYKAASNDEQQRGRLYTNTSTRASRTIPQLTAAQDGLEREAAVVPVTLELGIVMLQRAHGRQTDPSVRKMQL